MPRTRKAAGTAVDKRNGRRAELAVQTAQLAVDTPDDLCDEAFAQWEAFWQDPVATLQTVTDRGVVLRWIDALDRYLRTLGAADESPLVKGSQGQLVENPLYKIADKALRTVEACEKQLGIGAHNRAGLGLTTVAAKRSLADMNARYSANGGDGQAGTPETDPRVLEGEVVEGEPAA